MLSIFYRFSKMSCETCSVLVINSNFYTTSKYENTILIKLLLIMFNTHLCLISNKQNWVSGHKASNSYISLHCLIIASVASAICGTIMPKMSRFRIIGDYETWLHIIIKVSSYPSHFAEQSWKNTDDAARYGKHDLIRLQYLLLINFINKVGDKLAKW